MSTRPYTVQLSLGRTRLGGDRADEFDVELTDTERTDTHQRAAAGTAFLDLRSRSIPDLGMTVGAFLDAFLRGDGGTQEDGLRFGQFLLRCLLADAEVRVLWDEIQLRCKATRRPLRLELLLPADDAGVVSDIPFELLADEGGPIFRRHGTSLVRAIRGLEVQPADLPPGAAVLVAWASPAVEPRLPQEVFDQHEGGTRRAAEKAGLTMRAPCPRVTRQSLEASVTQGGGTPVLSLVAHGDTGGGAVWLHRDGHPAYPDDPGDPVEARDLAAILRAGNVRAAFLWTCHSGRHNAVSGALAATLLQPEHGNLSAVVAAHAALRAKDTAGIVERTLGVLRTLAEGDLERAVAEGRRALPETDLQWAAPVYYARPSGGRSVRLQEAAEKLVAPLRAAEAPRAGVLEHDPGRWAHFRGRDDEIARGLGFLRSGRLLSVTGIAGTGKTEVALEIAREAARDGALPLDRALWLGLDGVTRAESLRAVLAAEFGAEAKDCPDDAALARRIGAARVLVVLDNAEDPIRGDRAGVRALVETLLTACGGLRVLLATRECLGSMRAAEEQEIRVTRLREADAREVFLSVAGERLRAEDREGEDLGKLLAWLDGHPLSLVLVARQVGTMSLTALLGRLERDGAEAVQAVDWFGEEVPGNQDEKLRKERLASSLNLSYRPLAERTPGAAAMFAWLGYFPAGLPGVLVPYVFGEEGEENRALLLRKCLAEEVRGEKRLVLPAPIRAYARLKVMELPEATRAPLWSASFEGLAGWLGALKTNVGKPGTRAAVGLGVIEAENIKALLQAMDVHDLRRHQPPGYPTLIEAMAMASSRLGHLMIIAGRSSLAVPILLDAQTWTRPPTNGASTVAIARALGELYTRTGRLSEAEKSLTLASSANDPSGNMAEKGNIQKALGTVYFRMDRLKDAETLYYGAISSYVDAGVAGGRADTLQMLGDLFVRTDRTQYATMAYEEALPIYQAEGDPLGEANTLRAIGDLLVRSNRLPEAEAACDRALHIYQASDLLLGQANTLETLATLYLRTGRMPEADSTYRAAQRMFQTIEEATGEANATEGLGQIALKNGDLKGAFGCFRRTMKLHEGASNAIGVASAHAHLARTALAAGRPLKAIFLLARAIEFFSCTNDRFDLILAMKSAADIFHALEDAEACNSAICLAWWYAIEIDDPFAKEMSSVSKLAEPPENRRQSQEVVLKALASFAQTFQLSGEDPYSPPAP